MDEKIEDKRLRVYYIDRRLEQLQAEVNAFLTPRQQEAQKLAEEKQLLLEEISASAQVSDKQG